MKSKSIDRRKTSFDYASDHANEPQWNPYMEACEKLADGAVGIGTRYRMVINGKAMTSECVRFDRPNTWSLVGDTSHGKAG